ncbi:scavenger receptor class B member 1-like isoform X1 [Myxocyprinus asiaticus]|uniref:scavenger receptor class B member 1-like isoform X1 n=1 Tax=Myxocyprinus asiaticus TaxID=70543 RepID=UPI0022233571|nr:scavenger receptor class B member 1-like isoform X1 [Myxocyprinus asiaticus]
MAVPKSKLAIGLLVLGSLGVLFGTVLVFVGPIIIDDQIVKNVKINPKNDLSYSMWKDIPVPFFMSVYFYHVVNPEEILNGEKPMVEQRGPYVYSENRWKDNITFHDNNTVSYQEYRQYFFEESMSVGDESDVVTIPNMLVLGAAVMMEDKPYPIRVLVSTTFKTFNEGPFLTKPVGELMWGYESKLVDFLNKYLPGMLPSSGKFGLFAEFNNSNSGQFTVFTGQDDIRKVHMVDYWNGLKNLSYWNSDQCNMINGTAGQMWPPFMTTESTLPFYSPDACRSMELVYQRSGVSRGIPVYRYVAPKTLFANGKDYPPNEGFCPCRQSGLLNVSTCRHNSPVFISHPHFYNADPVLLDTVNGLSPNEEEHGLFIDVHPETGVPINVSIRLQLNLLMKNVSGISETGKITEVVMPMIWFEESGYIDGPVLNTFRTNLVVLPMVMEYMQYIFIGLGLATILGAVVLFLSDKIKSKMGGQCCTDVDPVSSTSEKASLLQNTKN